MNCRQVQDELMLWAGHGDVPEELTRHVEMCAECRSLLEELRSLEGLIGTDRDFCVSDEEVERLAAGVDERIGGESQARVIDIRPIWRKYVPVAAAAVIIVGVSLMTYITANFNVSSELATHAGDTMLVDTESTQQVRLTDSHLDYLLYDYATEQNESASSSLIEDLTDEEYEYLLENFDAEEIL